MKPHPTDLPALRVRIDLRAGMPSDQLEAVCQSAQQYCDYMKSMGGTDCLCDYMGYRCGKLSKDFKF